MPRSHDAPDTSPLSRWRDSASLPLLLAALVFLAALAATYAFATSVERTARAEMQSTFNYRARDLAAAVGQRMAVYEEMLQATRGYLRGAVTVSRADFADYYGVLRLDQRFPGIEALGIATILAPGALDAHVAAVRAEGYPQYALRPGGARPTVTAITHIQPFGGRNLRAFGYDMFSEPVRRKAMEAARDGGRAAATGKVTLVQEGGSRAQSGFLIYVPVYRAGLPRATLQERRAAILGWVFAPFRMDDLMRGVGGEHAGDLEVDIYDGLAPDEDALLYRSPRLDRAGREPLFAMQSAIDTAGRPWTLRIRSAPAFEDTLERRPALAVAATGIGLGLLLALVVWLLATERRRALQLAGRMTLALRASHDRTEAERQRIRLILQTAYDAFVGIGPDGRITDWNAQACKLFGWHEEEALGHDACALLALPDQQEERRACIAHFARSGACAMLSGPTEIDLLTRQGQAIPVEIAITPLPTEHGYGITAFLRDIRPRRETEQRERRRQQRLDEARSALARSQKLEAVGKLTGGVAHDFNNILHIISANAQLMLRADSGDRGARKRLLGIMDAVERGKKLAAQLLAFARRQPLHPSVVNLAQLIERMDSLLHRAAGDGVQIRFDMPPDLWNTLVDPNQLENVLLNLVINARDAMEGQGSVAIALANVDVGPDSALADTGVQPGAYVSVAVSDTGSGMPPDVMERAFEPFFTTKPEGKGTGLGLSMAHGFVKQSGGHIRLASTQGEGTTVTIYLPRALQDTPDPAFTPVPH
ncbi:CHASE domain-containing protein [uncultured Massilia sp.]|uniref:CHASE domain-containing protein n=1 Tax=uncultured Massilia sp. TaxID=169973 RepID=UPI0025D337DA|nr:CHASE domain-containing protein [uncultured Massilia sp.]